MQHNTRTNSNNLPKCHNFSCNDSFPSYEKLPFNLHKTHCHFPYVELQDVDTSRDVMEMQREIMGKTHGEIPRCHVVSCEIAIEHLHFY